MDWSKSALMLACGTLVLVVSSSAGARPGKIEVRDDVTFSQAIADPPANPWRLHGHADPKVTWDHLMHDDDLAGAILPTGHSHGPHTGALETPKYPGKNGHKVAPVTAIPEPSTYAMIMAGLAGIAFMTQRRRRRSQEQ